LQQISAAVAVKTQFSIKDLENLTDVKAHTIRIWEKRYNLLTPDRTDTNIRQYDLENLKKLLNISLLYNQGHKISKLARKSDAEISNLILSGFEDDQTAFVLNEFKTVMLDFDTRAFDAAYNKLLAQYSFRELFLNFFVPLLGEIGTLWQTGTIDPSHERFISELIKQKIIVNTNQVQQEEPIYQEPVIVLYLPYEEIHEIGLLYANYEILKNGFKTIYLGINIPLESLKYATRHHQQICFLSYFTVKPDDRTLEQYCADFNEVINVENRYDLWVMGAKARELAGKDLGPHISAISDLQALIAKLETLKKS
jgi:DNA-binding transcriptional MerR regulator